MKFKQVLAGLLVGTMVVTSAPVSGLGALSALAASEEAENSYTKLTGLTGTADSEELTGEPNKNGPIDKALDGKTDTYWHTNWQDDSKPKAETDGSKLTKNNSYTITLAKPSTVTAFTYVPRSGYEASSQMVNNGAIEQCKVFVTTDGTNWELAGEIGEDNAWSYVKQNDAGADQNFTEKKVTFTKAYAGVTKVKVEAIKTAGPRPNEYINAAEFGVIGKEEAEDARKAVVAPKISVTAPADGETPKDVTSLDRVITPQVFEDATENPVTLTSDNLTVTKEKDDAGEDIQAFSGQITAENSNVAGGKFDITGTTPAVIKFRIKADKVSDTTWLAGKMDKQYGIQIGTDTLTFYSRNDGDQWPEAYYTFTDDFWGKWHEIVAVYTGNRLKLFVDGNEGTLRDGRPVTATWISYAECPFTIGYNPEKKNGSAFRNPYEGKFADMSVYSGGDVISAEATYDDVTRNLNNMTQIFAINAKAEETVEPNYTVATAWTDSKGDAVTTFEEDKAYTLTATLTAKAGYKFTEESKPATIKVGETDVNVDAEVSKNGKTMILTHTFSVPAETTKPSDKEYGKLEGLTGKADSEERIHDNQGEDGATSNALDGKTDTYWHTNWSDPSKPKATYADGKLTGNNTYTITLAKATTVKAFTYIPRNLYDNAGNIASGAISECKVFVSTDNGTNWTPAGKAEGDTAWTYVKKDAEGADQNFAEKTLEFGTEYADVTDVKVEVIKTAGAEPSKYINAAEFGVIGEKDAAPSESEARKALAAALAKAEKVEAKENYTADSYKTFEEALTAAKAVTDETSDADVQAAATALENAIKGLKKAETPAPPVTEDSVITAPRLSYTAPVAGETAVVPSYVAMEDQSAKPATLEVKDDVPTTVVEDGGVLAFQGRLTAPNNGANNDKFDVSGDTPMVLRTKVKLKNKTDEVVNILGKMDSQYGIQVDGANDRVILYCCDAQGKWPEVQYKYDADTFWGEWHDIALVYTGTNMQLYVDGKAGEATPGRVNASDGYQVVFKSYASSIFTIGYNTEKSTNHEADGNGVKYSTLDQVDGKIADIKLYKGTDYSEGLTKSYDDIKAALEKVAPDADISAIPYTAVTTWSANGTALEKDAKFAGETVYTATTVYTARSGFKFTDISKPSVDDATVTIAADGKTMTVTKTFPKTAKIVCSCVVGEITGVADQTIDLGVADSKTVTLSAKAQVTGDCKVEGHDGTVNYTYTVTDAGTTGATVKDNAVTVTAAGTAKVKVTATLASDATKTSTKEITLTVTTNKASAQDKADLAAAINAVKDIKEADYTEESYAPLKNALAKANTLKDKTDVSKTEIEDAIKAISDAKKGLKTKVAAKKEELNSLLTAVYDDLMANGNKYTVASYNNAVTVYKAVKDLPGKDGVTVAELEKAIKDLNDAKDALVLQEKADLEKAKENAANTLKDAAAIADAGQKDYEEASWKVFDAAYKALKNAPADADKATLESLTLALRNAQAALKKAETPAVALDAPKVKAAKAKVTKTGVVVNVTVEAVKDAASYDVYRVVKGKATKVGTTAAGKTTVKDKKAVKGASYYAVAVSKDGKVVSKAGAAVAVKLAKAPKIQKATAGSKNAKLSWKKVKGAKVVVYRSTKKNSGYKKVATTRKNATSVTNKKGLKAGKTYYYKIATIKGKLISAMSKAKRVKIKK